MKHVRLLCLLLVLNSLAFSQQVATITETVQTMKTYPFSDPDPVAQPANKSYPYFRFDGFATESQDRQWKVVVMENDYIKVLIFPEIGGKIWAAIDKSNGNDFIYYNHVVKFRDIAMRGAWTSGGIEINFGIIGHAPTCSTPIDYLTRSNDDGSVSCFLSATDMITDTTWSVEVNLPKDKAFFTTKTTWYNPCSVAKPYYHWMNAAYHVGDDTQFCFPGQYAIGHSGKIEATTWPQDEEGRDLLWYKNHARGGDKSLHVLGQYSDFYAAYWHDKAYGSGHYCPYDEKLGMKMFLWSVNRSGAMWEDLLTDTDGQYCELQAGRVYSQAALNSRDTPYKLTSFSPLATETWTEHWFPVGQTRGVVKASPYGALNVLREDGQLKVYFCPLQKQATSIRVLAADQTVLSREIQVDVLEVWTESISIGQVTGDVKVIIGDNDLVYSEAKEDNNLDRPNESPEAFDRNSLYGTFVEGEQQMNYGRYRRAERAFANCLEKDPFYLPALNSMASLKFRSGRYDEALQLCKTSLSINTYDGPANYLYGVINARLHKPTDAKGALSLATLSPAHRSASYAQLAQLYLEEKNWRKAEHAAVEALDFNRLNLDALQTLMVVYRRTNQGSAAKKIIRELLRKLPLNHYARFERYLLEASPRARRRFVSMVRGEFPDETFLSMARWYYSGGCLDEALTLLSLAPESPMAGYYSACILAGQGREAASLEALKKANAMAPDFVFPYRTEDLEVLEWARGQSPSWKISYYRALIHWHLGDTAQAKALLRRCGDVGFAPLHMSRALLEKGPEKLSELLAAERITPDWRVGLALINYYLKHDDEQNAYAVGRRYHQAYPANYYIGLRYAKALVANAKYAECIQLLKEITVLPNEGAYEGRDVYRKAHLHQALAYLKADKYPEALNAAHSAGAWPENLGVGRPSDEQIDARLEDFICALIYDKQGHSTAARDHYEKVINRVIRGKYAFSSGNCLVVIALQRLGEQAKAEGFLRQWLQRHPESEVAKWCNAMVKGDMEQAQKITLTRDNVAEEELWEGVARDYDVEFIVELLQNLN
jgi:tetratricopeptide (TPR) repeat protein